MRLSLSETAATIGMRQRILAAIGASAILIGIVAGGYFLSGFYSVATSTDDSTPVVWLLTRVRSASIARRAAGQPPFSVDDPAQIQDGARRYAQYGCTHRHGAPGAEWSKFSEGLNSGPPDLKEIANELDISSIFWLAKNGIRMTGMPSFGKARASDNELWQVAPS
jgi:hypothetical protein